MKGDRRHELKHNELLDWCEQAGPWFKENATWLLTVVIVVLFLFIAFTWWRNEAKTNTMIAWEEFSATLATPGTESLAAFADRAAGTPLGDEARVIVGDRQLMMALQELDRNKDLAKDDVDKAIDTYQLALDKAQTPMNKQRALLGLAKSYETMAAVRDPHENVDKAKDYYKQLAADYPEGCYRDLAESRLTALDRTLTTSFLDQFAVYDPNPTTFPTGPGGGNLLNDNNLLDSTMEGLGEDGGFESMMPPTSGGGISFGGLDGDKDTPTGGPSLDGPSLGDDDAPAPEGDTPPTTDDATDKPQE